MGYAFSNGASAMAGWQDERDDLAEQLAAGIRNPNEPSFTKILYFDTKLGHYVLSANDKVFPLSSMDFQYFRDNDVIGLILSNIFFKEFKRRTDHQLVARPCSVQEEGKNLLTIRCEIIIGSHQFRYLPVKELPAELMSIYPNGYLYLSQFPQLNDPRISFCEG